MENDKYWIAPSARFMTSLKLIDSFYMYFLRLQWRVKLNSARVKNDAFYLTGVCWVVNLDLVAIDSLKFSKFETYQ